MDSRQVKWRSVREGFNFDIVWKDRFDNDPSAILRSGRLCSVTKRNETPKARQRMSSDI